MVGKPPGSFDASPDLKSRILGEMKQQGIETSIRELVQESYEAALGNLGLPLLSRAERGRLRQLVQNDLLGGMVVKD
ncbi:MAG: hypothetical protein ACK2US_09890 [Anaerolineae bacterium]|jgi:hypothetical protein